MTVWAIGPNWGGMAPPTGAAFARPWTLAATTGGFKQHPARPYGGHCPGRILLDRKSPHPPRPDEALGVKQRQRSLEPSVPSGSWGSQALFSSKSGCDSPHVLRDPWGTCPHATPSRGHPQIDPSHRARQGLAVARPSAGLETTHWCLPRTTHTPPLRTELSPDHHYLSLCLFALI